MKFKTGQKFVFLLTFYALFVSGAATFLLEHFFLKTGDFGTEPLPERMWILRAHSIVSLWFLFLFGSIFALHVQPALRTPRRKISGMAFLVPLLVLCFTVPFLFYLADENLKSAVALFHTVLGFLIFLPFAVHAHRKTSSR